MRTKLQDLIDEVEILLDTFTRQGDAVTISVLKDVVEELHNYRTLKESAYASNP